LTTPVSTITVKSQPPAKTNVGSKERKLRERAKDPASRILALQRTAGNRAVNQLLQPGSGMPLSPDVRSFMEARFNYDFSQVRIHTDGRAAAFSRALGAQAYTVGHDIVFGVGQFEPSTMTGRALLAHELAHVVQSNGHAPSHFEIAPVGDATEMQAEHAAIAVSHGGRGQVASGKAAAIRLRRDPRLGEILTQIEANQLVLRDDEEALQWIWRLVRTIDYHDPDNILPVTEAVSRRFPHLVPEFSSLVERAIEYDRAQNERTMRLMQVQPHGPYGQYGPGVVLPVVSNFARPLLALFELIENLYKSAGAFVRGLSEGFSESVSEAQARQLSERLLKSAILNIIFPPVFLSGAVVGIVEDVVDTVRGIKDLIVNFREMASAAVELIEVFFSSEGPRVARQLGHEFGKSFADRITGMLRGNIFRFTYELGKFIGPTIIYTVLSFLGVPELLAAAIVTRLMGILRPLLQRFPRLLRIVEAIAKRLPKRHHGPHVDTNIDKAAEKQLEHHLPEHSPQLGDGKGSHVHEKGSTEPVASKAQEKAPTAQHSSHAQQSGNPPQSSPSANALPDIRNRFKSTRTVKGDRIYDTTKGELGVPGKVKTHRDVNAQRGVSQGLGEDAGHRIGNRFGAPGGEENLAPQNWKSNRFGTFKSLENNWEAKLKNGVRIEAEVTDITRVGENRPFMRKVKWTETTPDGKVTPHELEFANTHTPESRAKQNISPTISGQNGKVIDMEEARQRLRP